MKLIKLMPANEVMGPYYEYDGHDSQEINSSSEHIEFVFNLGLDEDLEDIQDANEILKNLQNHINYSQSVHNLLNHFMATADADSEVTAETMFYEEGDYNFYIYVPFTHPLIEANWNKKWEEFKFPTEEEIKIEGSKALDITVNYKGYSYELGWDGDSFCTATETYEDYHDTYDEAIAWIKREAEEEQEPE